MLVLRIEGMRRGPFTAEEGTKSRVFGEGFGVYARGPESHTRRGFPDLNGMHVVINEFQ